MGNRVLCMLFQASPGLMCGLCLERMLNGNNENSSRKKRIFFWIMVWLLIAGAKIWFYSSKTNTIVQILFICGCGLIVKHSYVDKTWKKWSAFLTLLVAVIFADMIYTVVLLVFTGETYISMDFAKMDMMVGTLIVALAGMVLALIASEIWCSVLKKGKKQAEY